MTGVLRARPPPPAPRPAARPSGPGLLLVLSALPVSGLALAVSFGVGLLLNLPSAFALLVALFAWALPVLGLASPARLGSRLAPLGLAAWVWSLALLAAVPLYFPQLYQGAPRAGIMALGGGLPEPVAADLADRATALLVAFGSPRPPLAAELTPEPTPDRVPRLAVADVSAPEDLLDPDAARVVLPYEGGGRALRVPVTFVGPHGTETVTMLFDTGATLTTLSRAQLASLGVAVPASAPVVTLQTANGTVEAPLALVPGLRLGPLPIDRVTVAVCDPCAEGGVAGLLGLNVTALFQVALDHDAAEIDLTRRGDHPDRQADVTHWVELSSSARVWTDARVDVEVTATNRADRAVFGLSIEVACPDRSFAVGLADVPAHEARSTRVSLPRGTDCSEYRVLLREARWGAGE